MIKATSIDDMELKIEIDEEFKKKLECLINEYRI